MKILICIKPDMQGNEIGPFETLALEAGLHLREQAQACGETGWQVDVITSGPADWRDSLVRALGMGADAGIHLITGDDEGSGALVPPSTTAARLAFALSSTGLVPDYDLVLTGIMSQDLMAGHTGPMLAQLLDLPCATSVVRLGPRDADPPDDAGQPFLEALREWEGGVLEEIRMPLPAIAAVQSGFYRPRYPSLSHMLKAKNKPVTEIDIDGQAGRELKKLPGESYAGMTEPDKTRQGRVVSGSLDFQVNEFLAFLKERNLL